MFREHTWPWRWVRVVGLGEVSVVRGVRRMLRFVGGIRGVCGEERSVCVCVCEYPRACVHAARGEVDG